MNKSTWITLGVLAVLVAILVSRQEDKQERGIKRMSLATVDTALIDSMEVKGKNPVILKRKGDLWVLASGREADQSAAERALKTLASLSSSHQLASGMGEEVAKRWGLDEAEGSFVVMKAGGNTVAEFGIGKAQAGRVAVAFEGGIYSVKGVFPGVYDKPASSWLETRVFKTEVKKVSRVEVHLKDAPAFAMVAKKGSSGVFVLDKGASVPEGFRWDEKMARSLVGTLSGLRVRGYVEEDPGADVTGIAPEGDRLVMEYTLEGSDAVKRETLVVGKAGEDDAAYARLVERDDLMTIPAYAAGSFRKGVLEYRALNLMNFDPSLVKQLSVLEGKKRLHFEKPEGEWVLIDSSEKASEGFELDSARVDRRVEMVAVAQAAAVASVQNRRKARFLKLSPLVSATYEDGREFTLEFGGELTRDGKPGFVVQGTVDRLLYWVPESFRTALMAGLESFKREPEPEVPAGGQRMDPEALSKLPPEVRQQIMEQLRARQAAQ